MSSISFFSLAQEETNAGYDERDNKIGRNKKYPFNERLWYRISHTHDSFTISEGSELV